MSRHNGHTCVLNRDRIETLAECIEGLWLNKEKGLLMQTYQYAGFDVAVYGSYDTVIIGGGTAGSSAAISAARCGNKTLIVEKEICLGGAAVGALVTPMMESFVTHERNFYLIEERLRVRGVPTRSKQMTEYVWSTAESKARVLEELYLEQGGEVLYEATLYTLSEQDYLARARFEDAVAKGDWYIDVHSATNGLVHMDKFERGEYYEIPYRCLINDTVENMMTVGRCISATFLAQASIRIQPTLIDMGDVAGRVLAASLAAAVPLADFDASGIMEGR